MPPAPGILVYGSIFDPDGQPIDLDEQSIRFDDGGGTQRFTPLEKGGGYSITGLAPGSWRVRADVTGFRPLEATLALSTAEPVMRHDLVLQRSVTLLIKVFTPDGKPLRSALAETFEGRWEIGVWAAATVDAPPPVLSDAAWRGFGRYGIGRFRQGGELPWERDELPPESIGRLEFEDSLPVYVSVAFQYFVLATQVAEPGAEEVVFTVPVSEIQALLGTVTMRVMDRASGAPLTDAQASLNDDQSMGGGQQADAEGRFVFPNERPTRLNLEVGAPGHEGWFGEVSVQPGVTTDMGTVALDAATSIRGVVRDRKGQPKSVYLWVRPLDVQDGRRRTHRFIDESGADGTFALTSLGRRRYQVTISSDDWASLPLVVDATAGDVENVNLVVEAGTLLRLDTRWPADVAYDIQVETDEGWVVSERDRWSSEQSWMKRLVPGRYRVQLLQEGRVVMTLPVDVAGEQMTVALSP